MDIPDESSAPGNGGGGISSRTSLAQLLLLSASFLFAFTAFGGVQNLESSMDLGDVSGSTAVAIIYVVFTVACLVGPTAVAYLGPKPCIIVQQGFMGLFVASQLYPRVWTVYPAAALLGAGASGLWVAQGEYLTFLSSQYARAKRLPANAAAGLFQGIFFAIYQLGQVSGNLVSSVVLKTGSNGDAKPPRHTVNRLFAVYVLSAVAGLGVMAVVRSKASMVAQSPGGGGDVAAPKALTKSLFATADLMRNPRLALLIPLFVANGLEAGFMFGDFTNFVIKPSLGEVNIGFTMALYAGVDALACLGVGKLSDAVGRPLVVCAGFCCHFACCLWLLFYDMPEGAFAYVRLIAAIWGVGDAVWNTLLMATVSACFPTTTVAAFSNLKMWQSVGVGAAFFYSKRLAMGMKLGILMSVLVTGLVAYLVDVRCLRLEGKPKAYTRVQAVPA